MFPPAIQNCQVYPESYTLDPNELENPVTFGSSSSNCTTSEHGYQSFITCSHPSILTDSYHGTGLYLTPTDIISNHIWRENKTLQVLFSFSTTTALTRMNLYYYKGHHIMNVYGMPALRFYALPDDFEFGSDLPNNTEIIHNVSICLGRNYFHGRHSFKKINVSQRTESSKVLMAKISAGSELFALSEVEFFTDCGKLGLIT